MVTVLMLSSVFCSPGTGGISTLSVCLPIEALVVFQLKVTSVIDPRDDGFALRVGRSGGHGWGLFFCPVQ